MDRYAITLNLEPHKALSVGIAVEYSVRCATWEVTEIRFITVSLVVTLSENQSREVLFHYYRDLEARFIFSSPFLFLTHSAYTGLFISP
jgi:hypothetical protein